MWKFSWLGKLIPVDPLEDDDQLKSVFMLFIMVLEHVLHVLWNIKLIRLWPTLNI